MENTNEQVEQLLKNKIQSKAEHNEKKTKGKSPEEIQREYEEECQVAQENTILRVVSGSRAYGTQLPTSDYDERGIFIDIPERVWLPFKKLEQVQLPEDDIVIYELSKYMTLLTEQNPNIMELIWTEPEDVKYANNAGKFLLENRSLFLSKDVCNSYSGYAMAQLRRIKGHNNWINNPQPEEPPQQKDFISLTFNMTDKESFNKVANLNHSEFKAIKLKDENVALFHISKFKNIPANTKGWIDRLGNPAYSTPLDIKNWADGEHIKPDLLIKVQKLAFETAKQKHKDYWTWKNQRNETRGALEEAYGYDTKHAMHLIRLLRSGIEILQNGIVPVRRKDAQELLDIRAGKFTYEELVTEASKLESIIKEVAQKSSLPEKVDVNLVKDVTFEMYRKHWDENGVLNKPSSKFKP